jgi:hypothetical protein
MSNKGETTGGRRSTMARVTDDPSSRPPAWLWRLVYGGLLAAVAGVALLAAGLSRGWADPPRAGPLRWQTDFKAGAEGWQFQAPPSGTLAPLEGALVAEFAGDAADQWAVGLAPLTDAPAGDFTLEVAGAAVTPGSSAAYGLVFGWQDPTHYSALLINANGYAEAYRRSGGEREQWFVWQQWPHILIGPENNRLRVDVRGQALTLRVNDEVVATASSAAAGQVGVAAVTTGAPAAGGRVVFSWVRLWAEP